MTIDIFNPQISVVAKGLEGKVITIYGSNNLGKTKQSTRMKKPLYLPFEKGLNAIAGVPFMPINSWGDFKKVNKQLTKNPEKAKEAYQTIIVDEVDAFSKYATRYVCDQYDVDRIKDGNDGFGLWKEYETEIWEEINKLLNVGFTVVFIAHAIEDKDGKIIPKGDKRVLAPVIDNSDIVLFLSSNGVDEDNRVIKSSAWLAETKKFFARSRFDYIDTYIEEFTAENLEKAVIEAIKRQEEAEGIQAVTYEEQKQKNSSEKLDYDQLMEQIIEIGTKLSEEGRLEEVNEVTEKHLGQGARVTECTKKQTDVMSVILDDLKDLLEN
ncbi:MULTISPECIES: ATP-binding protein [Bacillus]|uniref:AAA family ATPase n=1 Tax=Bacillus licheniformis TaxID=1402 RepID=A0AB37GFL9_BACLI|nr:AAA family ATPase [Bacillus licheniformis]MBW7632629.1 AAA family ATPase [Bacillus licheniformis]MDE1403343.1 AAA family ATPase [Bacillus licheniformis]MDH3163760.1 AAA family ATPase [Bacillus licheniformis]MDK7625998.1 AAA family ATPase [Bacillus licheniformis]MDQ9095503.1 AAA family ATPase [Bacillus licheniformis]